MYGMFASMNDKKTVMFICMNIPLPGIVSFKISFVQKIKGVKGI